MLTNLKTAAREWLRLHRVAIVVGVVIGVLVMMAWHAASAQTISVSPKTGSGSVTPTITYTVPTGGSCMGSGGSFGGTKNSSGSVTLAPVATTNAKITVTYKLDCTTATQTGSAALTWVPPTQNTDGSALTNLASYRIVYGPSASALTSTDTVAAPAYGYTLPSLAVGTWYFGVYSLNSNGVESALSNTASKIVTGSTTATTASDTLTVDFLVPKPPTGLAVVETTAYSVELDCKGWRDCARAVKADLWRLDQVVGSVPLGTACKDDFHVAGGYYRVERKAVNFTKRSNNAVIVARCV